MAECSEVTAAFIVQVESTVTDAFAEARLEAWAEETIVFDRAKQKTAKEMPITACFILLCMTPNIDSFYLTYLASFA